MLTADSSQSILLLLSQQWKTKEKLRQSWSKRETGDAELKIAVAAFPLFFLWCLNGVYFVGHSFYFYLVVILHTPIYCLFIYIFLFLRLRPLFSPWRAVRALLCVWLLCVATAKVEGREWEAEGGEPGPDTGRLQTHRQRRSGHHFALLLRQINDQ